MITYKSSKIVTCQLSIGSNAVVSVLETDNHILLGKCASKDAETFIEIAWKPDFYKLNKTDNTKDFSTHLRDILTIPNWNC